MFFHSGKKLIHGLHTLHRNKTFVTYFIFFTIEEFIFTYSYANYVSIISAAKKNGYLIKSIA